MGARIQLAAIALLLSACFSPTYQEGLSCSESGECPGTLTCIEEQCVSSAQSLADSGTPSDFDANIVDIDAEPPCEAGSAILEATGTIEEFTVPSCISLLTIEAFGAEGGGGVAGAVLGGKGARIKGDVVVTGGDVLQVLVGQRGADAVQIAADPIGEQGGGTGGGGTFVVSPTGDALIVAGGGGGASHNEIAGPRLLPGGDAGIGPDGQSGDGPGGGAGGVAGAGGGNTPNAGFHRGTGGGGFLSPGVGNSNGLQDSPPECPAPCYGTVNQPGSSFADGGAGGIGGSAGRNGGFGGGGSAGFTGGGGGGYWGGGAGGNLFDSAYGAGGGGSLNTGTNQDDSPGVRVGDGQVIITWTL